MTRSQAPARPLVVGIAQAAGAGVCFGTMAIFAKYAYRDGADSLPLLAARFSIATGLLMAYRMVRRTPRVEARHALRLMLLGGFGYAFEASLFFIALENAPAAAVSLVFYSYPMWVTLLGLLIGLERFRPRVMIALVLGSAGVALIFSFPEVGLAGPLYAAGAALAVAIYFLVAQIVARGIDSYAAATYTVAGAACGLIAVAVIGRQDLPAAALPEAGGLGAVTAAAFVLTYAALARIGSARASIAMMVEPVATVALAALLLDEDLTLRVAAATILIVAGLPILASSDRAGLDSPPADGPAPGIGRN